ncbi:MAG: hypothetical protein E7307_00820 [Butyrivibrio sp.]|nr:hypothetical protein [Butyrivibrio sp.]
MKRELVTGLLCALMLAAAGCGDKVEDSSGLVKEPLPETAKTTQTDEAEDNGNVAETDEAQPEETAETAEASGSDLYEAFKNGSAKVKYRGTGDVTSYLETRAVLTEGQSYSLEEIVDALAKNEEYSYIELTLTDTEYSMIDCGSDGVPELLATAYLGDEFSLSFIIKEIDGELVICYDQDSWSRSSTVVNEDGTIETSGSGGAAVHVYENAFVDAAGDYKFYYGFEETLSIYDEYYAYKTGEDYVTISNEGLDWEHIGVNDYYFEPDYQKRTHYYNYFMFDDNYEDVTTDADYDDSNPVKQKFTEAGINVYTASEINDMLTSRAKEIGWVK